MKKVYLAKFSAFSQLLLFLIFSVPAAKVWAQAPTIGSFTPASAATGASVVLTGTGFNTTAANNIVYFGATRAAVTAATATSITATVPSGATCAPITLLNTGTVLACASLSRFNPIYTPARSSIITGDFSPKVDFTSGATPFGVAIGDLDGDGKADIVLANSAANTISVLRNTATNGSIAAGSFAAKVDFATGTTPAMVAIGDLDGDGKPELAVVNSAGNSISVFLNTSTSGSITSSSFAAKVDFATGTTPAMVAIGDLDGDGKPDLAVGNSGAGTNTVSVLRNTASIGIIDAGSFAAKVDFGTGSGPRSVAIGDLDGDGKLDLAVGNATSSTVSVLRNTSSSGSITASSFAAFVDFACGTTTIGVIIGDLDGDGKLDLATANTTASTISVLRNTSSSGSISAGSFAAKVDFSTGGANPRLIAMGDLDGDGKPDLAVAHNGGTSNTITVFRNTATSGSISAGSFAARVNFATGTNPRDLAIGDLDGDGRPDLVASNQNASTVSVLRNKDFFTITFDPNGGSGSMPNQSVTTGTSANLTANTLTRAGYLFAGWATTSGGAIAYANSASYTMGTTNVTLYAQWYNGPSAPTGLTATPGINRVSLSFTAPGNFAITNYQYSTDNGASWTAVSPASTATEIVISGLSNCTAYNTMVRAVNSAGAGEPSTAVSVTPRTGVGAGTNWTSRTSAADNNWRSIAYGNGLFVAVAYYTGTGNRVMTSPDGIIWTSRTSAVDNDWWSVTYGNGLFVAVANSGTGNRVMTSPDGIIWTTRSSAADIDWRSVTYGNGLFVAVAATGTGNRVMTSPDGITWTIRNSAANNMWTSVTYGNGLFVAVAISGTGNRVMTSPDGITWTSRSSAVDNFWLSVTYGNGLFVAVSSTGTGNRVMTSPDGIIWTNRNSAADKYWPSVTYGNGLFVAVAISGTGNRVMTSPDGITWTLRSSAADNDWRSVIYGNGLFVAVAESGTGNRVMTSPGFDAFVPDRPVISSITPSYTSIDVAFTAPASVGGSAISNYEYSINGGSSWVTRSPASSTSPLTISGLTEATAYPVQLRAVNTQGSGCASSSLNTTTLLSCTPTSSTETISACGSYTWHGTTYTASNNTATFVTTNARGCDSTITLNLTITALPVWYLDADNDDYYTGSGTTQCYSPGAGYRSSGLLGGNDCDDADNTIWRTGTFYTDADGDNYTIGTVQSLCYGASTPTGYSASTLGTDCDDADNSKWRTASRYTDADGDGYGAGTLQTVCYGLTIPSGYVTNNTDCNDADNSIWRTGSFYTDADGDQYTLGDLQTICFGTTLPAGYTSNSLGSDCNDANAQINPGAVEICNGIDDNCDGIVDSNPSPVISGVLSFCQGSSTMLDAGAGYSSYLWSTGATTQTISVINATPVFVTVTNAAGCAGTSTSVTPTVNALSTAPSAINSSAATATSGTNFTLSVNGGSLGTDAIWKWYNASCGCGEALIGTGVSITVSQTANTTYFVRAEGNCNNTRFASLAVNMATTATCGDGRYAEQVVSFRQQKAINETAVVSGRSQSSKALCAPQNNNTENFVSLGFGGDITLKFGKAIRNGAGNDIRVYETTFGNLSCTAYPEKAQVFASQDGCRFVYLGEICQDGTVDLGALTWAQYVRIVDVSSKTAVYNSSGIPDGYDVDAVEALNGFETNPVADALAGGASEVMSYLPGQCRGGANIPVERSNKNNALGVPQGTDVVNFVSLGFGGKITLRFKYAVENNATGLDLQVVETSYGNPSCNSYPEKARFEGSLDGATWTDLGQLCQDGKLEMGTLPYLHLLRITDVSEKPKFGSAAADGFDVDGVVAINQCTSSNTREAVEIVDDIHTADELEIAGMLELYPNPASESATFSFSAQNASAYGLKIVNALGQLVYSRDGKATEGVNTIELNLENLSKGLYIVQLVQDGSRQQVSLVKK